MSELKFKFLKEDKVGWTRKLDQSLLIIRKVLEGESGDLEISLKSFKLNKSNDQLRGYWRIATNLLPYVKEQYGEICDKDFVSDLAKLGAGYSQKISKSVVPKSLTKATKEEMGILIEQLYKMCEFFGMKDYELTSSETRAMINYYENDK